MRVRLKFQKYGPMKFIGHLDVLRYFQKAFRRAGIDSEYTTGFNPHQIISFAAPLGLGLTSDSEYVDIGLNSSEAPEIMINKINEFMSEGFYVTGFQMLEEPADNEKKVSAMSLVSSADYLVSLKDGYCLGLDINNIEKFNEVFSRFYDRTEITIKPRKVAC
jgi:radical SAM-linked protein